MKISRRNPLRSGAGSVALCLLILTVDLVIALLSVPAPVAHGAPRQAPPLQTGATTIGASSTAPLLDGNCLSFANEYLDAATVNFHTPQATVIVHLKHTATDLWVCLSGMGHPASVTRDGPNAAVYIQRIDDGPATPNSDTVVASISFNGEARALRGGRNDYLAYTGGGWSAARFTRSGDVPDWDAEFRLSREFLGQGSWDRNIRIAVAQQWINAGGDDYGWPSGYFYFNPGTWALGRLTSASAPSTLDLRATRIEVTQAIQSRLGNTVPLVALKRTFVRVYALSNESGYRSNNVTARLFGRRGATSLGPLLPLNPGGAIAIPTRADPGVLNRAFLFELPSDWMGPGSLELTAEINPLHNPSESDFANNRVGPVAVNFVTTAPLALMLRNIGYSPGSNLATVVRARPFDLDMLDSWLRRAFPINRLDSIRRDLTLVGPSPLSSDIFNRGDFVRDFIRVNRLLEGNPRRIQVGIVTDAGGFMRGKGWVPADEVATPTGGGTWGWDFDGSYGDWYGAHEIAHALGRPHAGRIFGGDIGCGADWYGWDEPFPYDHSRIGGPEDLPPQFFGFDAGDPSLRLPMAVVPPTWTDVMSYCNNQWVSDFTYIRLREGINRRFGTLAAAGTQDSVAPAAAAGAAHTDGDWLVVAGTIDSFGQTARFNVVSREPSLQEIPVQTPGDYSLRLLDAAGTTLSSQAFTPISDTEDVNLSSFLLALEFQPGARRLVVVDNRTERTLVAYAISAKAPQVSNVAQDGGSSIGTSGSMRVSWNAEDADGADTPLTYSLRYSFDNGATWRTLMAGGTANSVAIDVAQLEGTGGAATGLLQVVASDGANTGRAMSAPFAVANKAPTLRIASPGDGSVYGFGQTVAFQAIVDDLEDGLLPDASVHWKSSIDGDLGTDLLHHESLLSPGVHTITALATDASGATATADITLTILDDVTMGTSTAPTLDVAPTSLLFLGRAGDPPPASLTVAINNLAGGPLAWQATTGAPWLHLSPAAGSDEAEFQVSADSTGMLPGEMRTATITLTAPGAQSSPQTIHVTLQMEGYNPLRSGYKLYMSDINRDAHP
ncbi:MAG: BACON domain-containing protein [Caldilineaceae bacterium]